MRRTTRIDDLIRRAKTRDKDALGELYDAYLSRIYRFVYFRVGNREDAEDLTEQVFVKIFEHIETYEERGLPFEAWIFRIARNQITDFYRAHKEKIPLEEAKEVVDPHPMPEEETEQKLEYDRVRAAMKKLPMHYEEIILLKFIEEKSTEEMSLILGKSAPHVRVLAGRAIAKLREILKI